MIYSYTYQFWIEETEFPLKSIKYDINNLQEHKLSERIKLEGVGWLHAVEIATSNFFEPKRIPPPIFFVALTGRPEAIYFAL